MAKDYPNKYIFIYDNYKSPKYRTCNYKKKFSLAKIFNKLKKLKKSLKYFQYN